MKGHAEWFKLTESGILAMMSCVDKIRIACFCLPQLLGISIIWLEIEW